jgi:predicted nucleic acid-binding Zn ribbon protein
MWETVLRLGLWILIIVLALYVLSSTYADQEWVELIPPQMLTQALSVGALLVVAGIALRILGVGARVVTKNRCRVCRTPISPGAMYCREHLRTILSDEDEKTHVTRIRR